MRRSSVGSSPYAVHILVAHLSVPFDKLLTGIPQDLEEIRKAVPPVPPTPPPVYHVGEDKLLALQKTVNAAIKEAESVLLMLQKVSCLRYAA